jgi:hypothetical protein
MSSRRSVPDAITIIHNRKSVRSFARKAVEKEDLEVILQAAARLMLALVLALLPGCVSIEQQCRQGQWRTIGYDHGAGGDSPDFAQSYLKSCPPLGVTPDEDAMEEGWTDGNKWYCRPESIGADAASGSLLSFPEVCLWRRDELWPSYVDGRCRYLEFQIPSNEQSLVNLRQKFDEARDKGKKAHLSILLVGLRGVIHAQRSEYADLRCGR